MIKRIPSIMDKAFSELAEFWEGSLGKESKDKYINKIKRDAIKTSMSIGSSGKYDFYEILMNKKLFIGYVPSVDTSFITTDNPIVMFRKNGPDGIRYLDTEIYFPLTQRCILMLVDKNDDNIEYFKIPYKKKISNFNKYIASFSKEIIVGRDKELIESISNSIIV